MIFKGSRYAKTAVINPPDTTGENPRSLAARVMPKTSGAFEYTVMEGERLDQLAARFYSEPKKYWLLLDANPEPLNPFELLVPGRRIKIPKNRI